MPASEVPPRARYAIVALASLSASLAVGIALLVFWLPRRGIPLGTLHSDEVRRAAVAELLAETATVFDSHPDATVSRVLQPKLKGIPFKRTFIKSNRFGMREKEYSVPKRAGIERVVLLGDSFVFGLGVQARERFGWFLQRRLRERSRAPERPKIEVLHVAIGSWNTLAECAFLRRQLTAIDPDLVVQVFVSNDLDDNAGVRGFGVRSDFDPAFPEHGDGTLRISHPVQSMGGDQGNALALGIDGESRARYAAAFGEIGRLASALEARGTPYVLMTTLDTSAGKAALEHARAVLDDDQILTVGNDLMLEPRYRISKNDGHWNPVGQARVAQLIFAVIQERDLMPQLRLERWDGAAALIEEMHARTMERIDAAAPPRFRAAQNLRDTNQVYGGIDAEHRVAPHACFVLTPSGRSYFELRGSFFDRPEMAGGTVTISIDGVELARVPMRPGERFVERMAVPADIARRPLVAVQLASDEWALVGHNARDCVSFQLEGARFLNKRDSR